MSEQERTSTGAPEAASELARLCEEFFEVAHTTDPFNATQLGVSGFDALVHCLADLEAERAELGGRVLRAMPLGVLDQVVTRWADGNAR